MTIKMEDRMRRRGNPAINHLIHIKILVDVIASSSAMSECFNILVGQISI
jgi:hypothetical protein